MSRVILSVTAVVVGVLASGFPSDAARSERAEISAEGISSLTYAPKPFVDTSSRMRVDFTTTGRARPGHYYDVYVFIDAPDDARNCVSLGVPSGAGIARRIVGGPGESYTVWLAGVRARPADFCHGKAELAVISRPISRTSTRVRVLRAISFRVLHAP
jgi:hypothetical protein